MIYTIVWHVLCYDLRMLQCRGNPIASVLSTKNKLCSQVRSSPVRQRELFPDLDTLLECLEYDTVYVEVLLIMLFRGNHEVRPAAAVKLCTTL